MKTTEIFVEQVIIGFLVLMIAALPFYPQIKYQSELVEGWEIFFSFAAAALGIAYMLGIVFDRFADSLVADLTEHQRRRVVDPNYWSGDYPEARLRIAILEAGDRPPNGTTICARGSGCPARWRYSCRD
jgi:hypothetical protein